MRMDTTTRDASRDHEVRLYRQSERLRYDSKPVIGAALDDLDRHRLRDYFGRVLRGDTPDDGDEQLQTLPLNLEMATIRCRIARYRLMSTSWSLSATSNG